MTSRRLAAACALIVGFLALVVVPPCTADSGQLPPYGQRTDAFRRLLFELRFQPLRGVIDLHTTDPRESLLIVLGDPSGLSKRYFRQGLRAFVEQGGAVLIATDYETKGEVEEQLRTIAGVGVSGEKLVCTSLLPDDYYAEAPYCPLVLQIKPAGSQDGLTYVVDALAAIMGMGSGPSLFRNPRKDTGDLRVATNAPSRLKLSSWRLPFGMHRLARLPTGCVDETQSFILEPSGALVIDLGELERRQQAESLFAVGGTVGKGRVLVLADHSIFINRMMLPSDNNNLEFAANCLHWLRGGVSTPMEALHAVNNPETLKQLTGQRNKVLFWDDGRIRTDFEVPLKTMPMKPSLGSEPALVAALDKTIANMEANDYFNRQLLNGMDELPGGQPRIIRYAVYLLTLAAALLLGYRFLWRSRHLPESVVPMLAEVVSQHASTLSLLEQRRRALLRSGNVWEIVHRLARECFASAGVSLTLARPPRVEMQRGNWRQRWRVKRRVARLWRLARGEAPVHIPRAALQRWLHELEELRTALRDGTLRLNPVGSKQ